jgi:hypothetical protein
MSRYNKSGETVSENDNTGTELVAYSLTRCSDLDFHSDSEYMEPVSIYSEPSDCGTAARLQNDGTMLSTETGQYATVCITDASAPSRTHPPTLPNPNGIRKRRAQRAGKQSSSLIYGRLMLKRCWETVERFVEKKSAFLLCAAMVMSIFGCIGFFISIGVAARGTPADQSTCTCNSRDLAQSIGKYQL